MTELLEDVDSELEAGAHDEDSRTNDEDDEADFSVGDRDEDEDEDEDEDDFEIYESDLKKVCQSGFSHVVAYQIILARMWSEVDEAQHDAWKPKDAYDYDQ